MNRKTLRRFLRAIRKSVAVAGITAALMLSVAGCTPDFPAGSTVQTEETAQTEETTQTESTTSPDWQVMPINEAAAVTDSPL